MMYLRTYEVYKKPDDEYWKISTKDIDIFEVSLFKIGFHDIDEIKQFLNDNPAIEDFCLGKDKFIYVGLTFNTGHIGSDWNWSENESDFSIVYTNYKYKYGGEIEVSKEEIEDWQLRKSAKKYNL